VHWAARVSEVIVVRIDRQMRQVRYGGADVVVELAWYEGFGGLAGRRRSAHELEAWLAGWSSQSTPGRFHHSLGRSNLHSPVSPPLLHGPSTPPPSPIDNSPTHIVTPTTLGAFRTRVTLEIDEPHSRAQGLLSNIYPIKMKDSIEFVRAMHTVEVDLRPYTTSKRRGGV
jgi:hypothetical protein